MAKRCYTKAQEAYYAKLRNPKWQKRRLEVFERDNWTCQSCNSTEETLTVHHRFYEKGNAPWDYGLDALTTLCETCHREEMEARPTDEAMLLECLRRTFLAEDLSALASGFFHLKPLYPPGAVAAIYGWALETPFIQRVLAKAYIESHPLSAELLGLVNKDNTDGTQNN